jgi:hypothetical protein
MNQILHLLKLAFFKAKFQITYRPNITLPNSMTTINTFLKKVYHHLFLSKTHKPTVRSLSYYKTCWLFTSNSRNCLPRFSGETNLIRRSCICKGSSTKRFRLLLTSWTKWKREILNVKSKALSVRSNGIQSGTVLR